MIRRRLIRRRMAVMAFAFGTIPLLACRRARAEEPDLVSPGTRDLTIQVGEDERTCRLHVPPEKEDSQPGSKSAAPRPLVIALHGATSSGRQMEWMTGFDTLADRKGFVVVYPDGENKIWRYWNAAGGKKDFQFISDLIDALAKAGTADSRRVYLTGISNGAYFANALAAEFGDRIAAIAPGAGHFHSPPPAIRLSSVPCRRTLPEKLHQTVAATASGAKLRAAASGACSRRTTRN